MTVATAATITSLRRATAVDVPLWRAAVVHLQVYEVQQAKKAAA